MAEDGARIYRGAEIDLWLPNAVARAGNVILQLVGSHELGSRRARRPDLPDLAIQKAVVAQDVQSSFIGVAYTPAIGGLASAELAAQGDFSFGFGFIGQQARGHRAGVDHDEGSIEELGGLRDFGLLRAIRDGVEGSADGEGAFLAAGVNIDHDAAQ